MLPCPTPVSVADADVITALITLGILEPAKAAAAQDGREEQGEQAQGSSMFKASDTAALRAVAVQVGARRL